MTIRSLAPALALVALACSADGAAGPPVRLTAEAEGGNTRLGLVAAPGVRLNARIKPALELPDGTVLRFDSTSLTPDSAYFAESPTTLLAGSAGRVHGTLRASICAGDELVCRSIVLEL